MSSKKRFNFVLSDAEDNVSRPLKRGDTTDSPMLRTLFAIHQKSQETSFWEVTDSFVLLTYARFILLVFCWYKGILLVLISQCFVTSS